MIAIKNLLTTAIGAGGIILADTPMPDPTPGGFTPVPYVILCGSVDSVAVLLRDNGEIVAAHGVTAKTGGPELVAQFWVNPKTHDWTFVYLDPRSTVACMVAAGTGFGVARAAPAGTRPGGI